MARFDKRESGRQRQARMARLAGVKGRGYVTGSADFADVEAMMNRMLDLDKKQGKKAMKHACRMALEVIDGETGQNALDLDLNPKVRKKGWRKTISKRNKSGNLTGAFVYKVRRSKKTSFWFYSAVNYKKPVLRISHLVEKGFNHIKSGFVPGNWFRKDAFMTKRNEAIKVLELNLLYGLDLLRRGKPIPNITQWKKGAPRG